MIATRPPRFKHTYICAESLRNSRVNCQATVQMIDGNVTAGNTTDGRLIVNYHLYNKKLILKL